MQIGCIEPHRHLLNVPADGQLLYKIMTVENLLRSIDGYYLHFNRVDSYKDSPIADPHDGQQLPKDLPGNARTRFEKAPDFSAADNYDRSRARTYACCFSLENSNFIWENYANEGSKGKVCVVVRFGKLRAMINETLQPWNVVLEYNGNRCCQIFSVNYGIVEYVSWDTHQANLEHLPNPIKYTYLKDEQQFSEEKEVRISLSAFSIGQFNLKDGSTMQFPRSLQLDFDFRSALADSTIQKIEYSSDSDRDFLQKELHKRRIVPRQFKDRFEERIPSRK